VEGVVSRRAFLAASLGTVAALRGVRLAAAAPPRFRSAPELAPPQLAILQAAPGAADGYVLVAPFVGTANGTALMADAGGEPVWIYQSPELVMNFKVQRYAGRPVLTWWEGTATDGYFDGRCVIADQTYRVVKRFAAGNGFDPEVHEFLITERDTALVTINNFVPTDLTRYGGPADGTIVEGVIQELDLATGAVLFEWHSLDHVGVDESSVGPAEIWDYFHMNSVDVDEDENLIVSARYPSTVHKLDRTSGDVIWRLGGAKSDFALGPDATFWFQHDARGRGGGLYSIFDDGADAPNDAPEFVSRAIELQLDTAKMTATLVRTFANPSGASTEAMGSAQRLYTGGYFVGWGTVPQVSEFSTDGSLVFNAELPAGYSSYRAQRAQWTADPSDKPRVATARNANGSLELYASWNGATRVTHWRVDGGATATLLTPLTTVPRAGFETPIRVARPLPAHVAAVALNAHGEVLGRSEAIAAT
jgi:hypothetical protein